MQYPTLVTPTDWLGNLSTGAADDAIQYNTIQYSFNVLASTGSSGSTSGTGVAFPLTPIHTPGDPLTEGGVSAAATSVSSSDESVSCDSVVVSELAKWDSISWG